MNEIIIIVSLPIVTGLLLFFVPEKHQTVKGSIALLISIITVYLTFVIYSSESQLHNLSELSLTAFLSGFGFNLSDDAGRYIAFNSDNLSKLIVLFISLLSSLILLYSIVYIKYGRVRNYYPYFLITLGCGYGAVQSDNLLLFLTFWGILGITLYKLIKGYDEESSAAAKKTLILIGASDSIMLIGIAIVWKISGSLSMGVITLPTTDALSIVAFLALLTGSFTKAGAFPFHTWVPDYTRCAPASSSAYLPASLDKLLGIYFLARLTTKMFILN